MNLELKSATLPTRTPGNFPMSNRWQRIDELRARALHMKPMHFGIEFPHSVLVASQIRGGRLVKQEITSPAPPRGPACSQTGRRPSTMVHVPSADVHGQVTGPELLNDRSPSIEFFGNYATANRCGKPHVVYRRSTLSCDVFLNDFTVSKLHAKIRYDAKLTTYHLEDGGCRTAPT